MISRIEIPENLVRPYLEALGGLVGTGCIGFVGLFIPGVNDDDHHEEGTVMVRSCNVLSQRSEGGKFIHMGSICDEALLSAESLTEHISKIPKGARFKPYVVVAPPGWKTFNPKTEEGERAHADGWSGIKYIPCPPEGVEGYRSNKKEFWVRKVK
ncbi:hypothetical protein ISS03_03085 [Patescibacteria group bacterium]|nr:hypothetical protein [Patescibacteria group bacterium]